MEPRSPHSSRTIEPLTQQSEVSPEVTGPWPRRKGRDLWSPFLGTTQGG